MRTLPPSDLTLGGMVKHLAFVEDWWFGRHLLDTQAEPWASVDWEADHDWDWHSAADDTPEAAVGALGRRRSARSRRGGRASDPRPRARALDRDAASRHHAALDPRAHGRGVRPAHRPRRPDPAVHRRAGGTTVDPPDDRGGLAAGLAVLRRDRAGRRDLRLPARPHLRAGPRALDDDARPARPSCSRRTARSSAAPPWARTDPAAAPTSAPRRSWSRPQARGRGVGRRLGEYVVQWHRDQGFRAIQFNAVVETNTAAVRLWQALGFRIIGTVPEAFDSAHARAGRAARHAPRAGLSAHAQVWASLTSTTAVAAEAAATTQGDGPARPGAPRGGEQPRQGHRADGVRHVGGEVGGPVAAQQRDRVEDGHQPGPHPADREPGARGGVQRRAEPGEQGEHAPRRRGRRRRRGSGPPSGGGDLGARGGGACGPPA